MYSQEELINTLVPKLTSKRKLNLTLSVFELKGRSMSVQNKMAPVVSILLRALTFIFFGMPENLIAGTGELK